MAKSMRSKREKRLRAIRREMVEPIYDKKDAVKQAALEAALSAPKLPVRSSPSAASSISMDVEISDGGINQNKDSLSLKPAGGVGKKSKKKGFKVGKNKGRGRWKPGKKHNI